ncbi:TPM domain-containing protein [Bacteroidota bacterium]
MLIFLKNQFPPRLVNDFINLLSASEVNELENKLQNFARSTSNQIAVVIVDDLGGYDVSDYAFRLGQKWGVGQAKFDNGVVIVIKPTGGEGERKTFIAVGYGLEGNIPDAVARRIVDHEMIPNFKSNNFYAGLNAATDVLMKLASEEYSYEVYLNESKPSVWPSLIIVLFFLFVFIFSGFSRAKQYSNVNNIPFWAAMMMMGSAGRGSGYSDFSSGRGSFGGGGGFGGFGGGGFGGGGAGGSW